MSIHSSGRKGGLLSFVRRFALILAAAPVLALAMPAAAQSVSIVVIGDSNVAGTGVSSGDTYPAQLEAALRARGLDVSVSNSGRNGEASAATASRASSIGSGTDVVVLWQGCANDRRAGLALEACRANNMATMQGFKSQGVLAYIIRPPIYDPAMHRNPSVTLAGEGRTLDFRDGRGSVPDGHFNRAGYAIMVKRTVDPIAKLVKEAQKRKKST